MKTSNAILKQTRVLEMPSNDVLKSHLEVQGGTNVLKILSKKDDPSKRRIDLKR
jgi:hypothetical protein